MRKLTALILVLALLTGVSGCSVKKENALTVDIGEVLDSSIANCMRETVTEWNQANPDISVEERSRLRDYDLIYTGALGPEYLPDIFVTDCQIGRSLAEAGLVTDLSGIAEDVGTFTCNGTVYAFPVLCESYGVMVYDPFSWEEGSSVGYCYPDTVVDCYLSSVLGDEWGQEWLHHMIEEDHEAAFTDREFVARLDYVREMLDNAICYDSEEGLINAFVEEECQAAVLSGDVLYRLMEQTNERNPSLYERLDFRCVSGSSLPCGYSYGVFIRSGMDDDRTAECVELAGQMTSSYVQYSDATFDRLAELQENSVPVRMLTHYFTGSFWAGSFEECFSEISCDDRNSQEYAFMLQNLYEEYYTY